MLIKNMLIYSENSPTISHVHIDEFNKWTFINENDFEAYDDEVIDAQGHYTLMPGMLDAHIHGHGGFDFSDSTVNELQIKSICSSLGKTGLSYAMATLISLSLDELRERLKTLNNYILKQNSQPQKGLTQIVGVHLEGPFIAQECKGAHDGHVLQEKINLACFKEIICVAPAIKEWKITLDPSLPGAIEFINDVKKLEVDGVFVKVFLGHCNPPQHIISAAINAGAVGFTHLGNACKEGCSRKTDLSHRNEVQSHLVQWVLEHTDLDYGIELIVDGVHLSESFVRLIHAAADEKIMLITDALGPSGLKDGPFKLGSLGIRKEHNNFYLVDENDSFILKKSSSGLEKTLAGSAASLSFCAQKYTQWIKPVLKAHSSINACLYNALIKNPRITSLSKAAIAQLPDEQNFVVLNDHGELVLSMCQGLMVNHRTLKQDNLFLSEHVSPNESRRDAPRI
ncbi:MAG: N-acetylglucosamine-6-phosphate deacetylase [Legionella sp.]|nr:N-acetylglucosamine-6-phosphate deacetylase [Legionella sp.]